MENRVYLSAVLQKIVYQGGQDDGDNQRTKRNLIRLHNMTQYGCWSTRLWSALSHSSQGKGEDVRDVCSNRAEI